MHVERGSLGPWLKNTDDMHHFDQKAIKNFACLSVLYIESCWSHIQPKAACIHTQTDFLTLPRHNSHHQHFFRSQYTVTHGRHICNSTQSLSDTLHTFIKLYWYIRRAFNSLTILTSACPLFSCSIYPKRQYIENNMIEFYKSKLLLYVMQW